LLRRFRLFALLIGLLELGGMEALSAAGIEVQALMEFERD
jgi:hypothetical protein